ncbi:MAG TPA: CHAP domain-containing protein [Candidatus Onthocola stercoravium]|nr:CHAP domain-containing protein [Candidatus Onthocola stercoravium]
MKKYVKNSIWIVAGGKMKFFKKNFLLILICFLSFTLSVNAATNPYGKYQDLYGVKTVRCTWYAWEQAYINAGVALPGWGNAQTWYNSAAMAGYSVGKEARANSIAVWSSSDSYGHVAYVVSVDESGEYMTVNEGGIPTEENEGIVIGSKLSTSTSNLIGFIYLSDAPKSSGGSTSSSNNSESKNKSSNNNLSNLEIDIADFKFNPEVTEYNLEVPYSTKIISIKAISESDRAVVTGAGEKALKVGENNYRIVITAEDGTTKEYKISITRNAKVSDEEKETVIETEKEDKFNSKILIVGVFIIVIAFTLVVISLIKHKRK